MLMTQDRGSISITAIILIFSASLLMVALGQLNYLEHKVLDNSIAQKQLRQIAEFAVQREYDRLVQDQDFLKSVLMESRPMEPTGDVLENEQGQCHVFVGEKNGQVIIWAVAERGNSKAQVSYSLVLDEEGDKFVLKGMF
ncbi:hypothetical protein [Anaerovibrio lipolyticus]|uniref:hypothetical protein n=1 Tax=Anaerovibrio lipolyticus TaxID=82374 RepID=UPI0026E9B672|nr:hypothetical protein [Anaerovibrio lipolyticus]MBE6106738.1 hypothetical protein [Anaerovibrio lipolyticus]